MILDGFEPSTSDVSHVWCSRNTSKILLYSLLFSPTELQDHNIFGGLNNHNVHFINYYTTEAAVLRCGNLSFSTSIIAYTPYEPSVRFGLTRPFGTGLQIQCNRPLCELGLVKRTFITHCPYALTFVSFPNCTP